MFSFIVNKRAEPDEKNQTLKESELIKADQRYIDAYTERDY